MRSLRAFACVPVLLALSAGDAGAQIRASEPAGVSQTIDGTRIAIEYSAPRVRGRSPLFGARAVVHWGEVWTPGANWATTLEVNKPFILSGRTVDKGKYSVWLIPNAGNDWTMVLDPDHHRFHEEPPDSNAAQIRLTVHPATGNFEEVLTWRFTDHAVSGATLNMQWGTMRVAMPLTVTPSLRMTTPADEAAPFLGRYEWTYDSDSAKKYTLTFAHENGYLMGHMSPEDNWPVEFAAIRLQKDWYTFGLFEKGAIVDVETSIVMEFKRDAAGRVVSFEVRDTDDKLWASAVRKP